MNRVELKTLSKEQIKGKIGVLFVIALIIGAVTAVAMLVPIMGQVLSFFIVIPAFVLSNTCIFLKVSGGGTLQVEDAFCGFNDFWSAFKVNFLVGLFSGLWSMLLVIPGIVKSISYSMSLYILAENKGKPALECIDESKRMTEGHKLELFVLGLSFIGWLLLGYFTLGIAYIWIIPYMQTTYANVYRSLKSSVQD